MYRCYFTQRGHIILGNDVNVATLPEAIVVGHRLLEQLAVSKGLDGLEIWENAKLLYASAGQTPRSSVN